MIFTDDEKKQMQKEINAVFFPDWGMIEPALYYLQEFRVPVQLIADKLGIKRPSVSAWMRGKKIMPKRHRHKLRLMLAEVVKLADEYLEMVKRQEEIRKAKLPDRGF